MLNDMNKVRVSKALKSAMEVLGDNALVGKLQDAYFILAEAGILNDIDSSLVDKVGANQYSVCDDDAEKWFWHCGFKHEMRGLFCLGFHIDVKNAWHSAGLELDGYTQEHADIIIGLFGKGYNHNVEESLKSNPYLNQT
jgi:hypothetical protein